MRRARGLEYRWEMSSNELERAFGRRPNMFIASSTEASDVAEAVKAQFERRGVDVDIWYESVFDVNEGFLASLLNLSAYYDFAVAVFSKDDRLRIRERDVTVTRGNVIFEFGLFLGRLGPRRAFFIAEEGVDIFSDWAGISTVSYVRGPDLGESVDNACARVSAELEKLTRLSTFTFLPTTSLAIGYYRNFLRRVIEGFRTSETFRVVDRARGRESGAERVYDTRDRDYVIHVEMPQRLRDLEDVEFRYRARGYALIELTAESRRFPFYIRTSEFDEPGPLDLFDVPTTMLAAGRAIRGIFDEGFLAGAGRVQLIEEREIANFQTTIERMMRPGEERLIKFRPWPDPEWNDETSG
jgi:hypothetical protein